MKKKEIEKIPYKTAVKSEKKYTACSFVENIKDIQHLFVEIYAQDMMIPHLRMVYTKTDWGMYWPQENKWTTNGIKNTGDYNCLWESGGEKTRNSTFMSEEDQDIIWEFCGSAGWREKDYYNWTDKLKELTDEIRSDRNDKAMEKRRERLNERIANTPELPQDLEDWAEKNLFPYDHFLYYKRKGRYIDIACSSCGQVTHAVTKQKESFEGQFEKYVPAPQNNRTGICPACGRFGTWKAKGLTKGVYGLRKYCYVGQPYKKDGAVIRYLEIEKIYRIESADETGSEMTGASESYNFIEIARRYFIPGKKPNTDFQKYSSYSGNFWDDCNLYGMANIPIHDGVIYAKTYELLKGTILQYSAAKEFDAKIHKFNLMDYMERYVECPQLELLTKMKLYGIVKQMVENRYIKVNKSARNPEGFLGICKGRLKFLIKKKGDTQWLETLQKEREMGAHWNYRELKFVYETGISANQMENIFQYTTMGKLINKLERYANCTLPKSEDDRSVFIDYERLRIIKRTYFDYIGMRQQRGYDLNNSVFLFPNDLRQEHDRMVEEINTLAIEKREAEVNMKYPQIKSSYRRLRNKYFYEDDRYIIRPARDAAEIVKEGRILHHCVGGDTYLEKHNEGDSIILFLREKALPETPYITIEIAGEKIKQWYGAYDKKPDKTNIDKWLNRYVWMLKKPEATMQAAG